MVHLIADCGSGRNVTVCFRGMGTKMRLRETDQTKDVDLGGF